MKRFTSEHWGSSALRTTSWLSAPARIPASYSHSISTSARFSRLGFWTSRASSSFDWLMNGPTLYLSIVLAERLAELQSGALNLVEDTRYRVRKLPIGHT